MRRISWFAGLLAGLGLALAVNAQQVQWVAQSAGGQGDAPAFMSALESGQRPMVVDGSGNTFLAGIAVEGPGDYLTIKVSPAGEVLWTAVHEGQFGPRAIAVDPAGDVVVVGNEVTIKYDTDTGAVLWIAAFSEPTIILTLFRAIAIDAAGDVYIAGQASSAAGDQTTIIKYDGASGAREWITQQGAVKPYDMAVDGAGDVVITGTTFTSYATVKYSGATGTIVWESSFAGSGSGFHQAHAVAVDDNGDIVVSGASSDAVSGDDFVTIKYAGSSGQQLWLARHAGPGANSDGARDLAIDAAGDVIVIGSSPDSEDVANLTIKYSGASGLQLWEARVDIPGLSGYGNLTGLAVDGNGDVLVAGFTADSNAYASHTAKFSGASGATLWAVTNPASAPSTAFEAVGVAVDAQGAVRVAGNMSLGRTSRLDIALRRLDGATGASQWLATEGVRTQLAEQLGCGGPQFSQRALAMDAGGNTLITGCSYHGEGRERDLYVAKISAAGTELWRHVEDGGHGDDAGYAVTVDAAGDVLVTGSSKGEFTNLDFLTLKLRGSDGVPLWTVRTNGAGVTGSDVAAAITTDASGDVFVTGRSYGGSGTQDDYLTVKYAGANGAELWTARFDSSLGAGDTARDIVLLPSGDVVVTGSSPGAGTAFDYVTIRYGGDSGKQVWLARDSGSGNDQPVALAVDSAGDLIVTGSSQSAPAANAYDYWTVKHSGASGGQLWAARYHFNTYDYANAVMVDAAGDVYVTGRSAGFFSTDAATVKYFGATGASAWSARYNSPANAEDEAWAVHVDAFGRVLVAGTSEGARGSRGYLALVYSAATGAQSWEMRGTPGAGSYNQAYALGQAPDGSFRVGGTTHSEDRSDAAGIVKIELDAILSDGFEGPVAPLTAAEMHKRDNRAN